VSGVLAALAATACVSGGGGQGPPQELLDWAAGPARWYLLAAERKMLEQVRTSAEAVNFIEQFWRLRDPDPRTAENRFRETFASRVEAADLLYAEGSTRGSLTPRGRAQLLLGPPVHLVVSTEPVLTWSRARSSCSSRPRSPWRRGEVARVLTCESDEIDVPACICEDGSRPLDVGAGRDPGVTPRAGVGGRLRGLA
jgi:GWxTD domain-containing protein